MFTVNEYKIVFKRRWHERATDINGAYIYGSGRYDTVCEIYVQDKTMVRQDKLDGIVFNKEPSFTGVAKLHPNDKPDKIVGKKIALRNAIGKYNPKTECLIYSCADFYNKSVRTAIWKAFWLWVASWFTGMRGEQWKEWYSQLPLTSDEKEMLEADIRAAHKTTEYQPPKSK